MSTHIKVHGLGDIGMQVISLKANETTLASLFGRIEEVSGIAKEQHILFTDKQSLTCSDHATSTSATLKSYGIGHGSDLNFVRSFSTKSYPSTTLRLRVYRARFFRYLSGALATLSTFAFLSRIIVGSEVMREWYPHPLGALAWWPIPYLIGFSATCLAALDVGHWIAGFPIVPSALFTLINKGQKQLDYPKDAIHQTLNLFELKLVKTLAHYLPALVREAEAIMDRNIKAVKNIQQNYGGTRLRLICADGIALDGMHVQPSKHSSKHSSSASGDASRKEDTCYIVVNANAEFYEMDGLYARPHSNCARYASLGFHVLLFNYRGVGVSEGTPTRDGLLLDLHSVIQYAISSKEDGGLNIHPSNIVVCGRSLGGAISTVLLSNIVHEHPNLILCNTRSFSTLSRTACKLLGQQYGHRIGQAAAYGIYALSWELDSFNAWLSLERFSSSGYRWVESVGDDDIILPGAKLADELSAGKNQQEIRRIIQLDLGDISGHNRALKSNEYQKRWSMIQEGLHWNHSKTE